MNFTADLLSPPWTPLAPPLGRPEIFLLFDYKFLEALHWAWSDSRCSSCFCQDTIKYVAKAQVNQFPLIL
jgi:hypothetical protein